MSSDGVKAMKVTSMTVQQISCPQMSMLKQSVIVIPLLIIFDLFIAVFLSCTAGRNEVSEFYSHYFCCCTAPYGPRAVMCCYSFVDFGVI